MGDGAHAGANASTSAQDAMQGRESTPQRTADEMRLYLLRAPDDFATTGETDQAYDEACQWIGSRCLAAFTAHPELLDAPMETEYDWEGDPAHGADGMRPEYLLARSVTDRMEELGYGFEGHGFSGFMVGWGVNAARYALGADYAGNPALVEVQT